MPGLAPGICVRAAADCGRSVLWNSRRA